MDCWLIMQQHDRGDYMITEKGFNILQSLNKMYLSLQYFPQKIYDSNLFKESKKEELIEAMNKFPTTVLSASGS